MSPRMMPRMTAEAPLMPPSQLLSEFVMAARGRPRTTYMSPPANRDPASGMMTTGMRPRSHRGGLRRVNP